MTSLTKKILWVTLFSIAMGFLESAVVVYLRELYYPNGFMFPLVPMKPSLILTEITREAATIIMLLGIGILSGKNATEKFAYFIYSFAIWDIFYYAFLKFILDWPNNLFAWDILFLIPVPWAGPVIAPCITSFTMIVLAILIIHHSNNNPTKLSKAEWAILIVGSLVTIFSFILDYLNFSKNVESKEVLLNYSPRLFNWHLFFLGEFIILTGIFIFYKRTTKTINYVHD